MNKNATPVDEWRDHTWATVRRHNDYYHFYYDRGAVPHLMERRPVAHFPVDKPGIKP